MTRPARGSGGRGAAPGARGGNRAGPSGAGPAGATRRGTAPGSARPEGRRTTTAGRRTVPLADEATGDREERPAPGSGGSGGRGGRDGRRPGAGVRLRFTGRAAVLLAVFVLLVVGLAYPLREYVSQRQQIGALEETRHRQDREIRALQRQEARWRDPAYVEQQARLRLHYARPGEITYVVVGDTSGPGGGGRGGSGAGPNWSDRLWTSVRVADHPAP